MVRTYRFHRNFTRTDEIPWDSGKQTNCRFPNIGIQSNLTLEFDGMPTRAYDPCVLFTSDAYSLVIKTIDFFHRNRELPGRMIRA